MTTPSKNWRLPEMGAEHERALSDLLEMLRYRRPHMSASERKFINRFIRPLRVHVDDFGNLYKRIGDRPHIMWSCHTDTVHHHPGKQEIAISESGIVSIANRSSNCLGADDAAGVWLMREMILAGVPGLYVFHRGEERGGLGSDWIAANNADLLKDIDAAVAFDRKGTDSIITHQMVGACCSDAFAKSLADAIGMGHRLDNTGTFTDTANYAHIIPECANVSVGYESEHGPRETLDTRYLMALREAMLSFDAAPLTIKRDPSVMDYDMYDDPIYQMPDERLVDIIRRYPEAIASLLEQFGITEDDVIEAIYQDEPSVFHNRY